MAPTSAAMELKVLINILTQGQALPQLLAQTKQLQAALTQLQNQANAAGGGAGTGFTNVAGSATKAAGAVQGASTAFQNLGNTSKSATTGVDSLDKALGRVGNMIRWVTGGFLAYQSVRFLKDLADTAARAEVLSTVLHVVALNSGYTADQIDKVDNKVQSLGITAEASRKSLTQFMQAGLKLDFAPKLARAAQDLAVISGMDSSSTFGRLIINIQQLDTMGLRFMGIVTDRAVANRKYKDSHKEITGELNKRQMQEALMIEVLEKAKLLEGAYATAMNDVGKQLTSLTRLSTTLRQELGNSLLPAYSAIVLEITTLYEQLILISKEFSANTERSKEWADTIRSVVSMISWLIRTVAEHLDQIVYWAKLYVMLKIGIMGLNVIDGVAKKFFAFIDLLAKLRFIMASRMFITFAESIAVLSTKSEDLITVFAGLRKTWADAASTGAIATKAMYGMATATDVAALSVLRLVAAWTTLLGILAAPVIAGYIAYKSDKEFFDKDLMQRAKIARDAMTSGKVIPPGGMMETIGAAMREGGQVPGAPPRTTSDAFTDTFEEWKKTPMGMSLAKTLNPAELLKEFNNQIDLSDLDTQIKKYTDKVAEAQGRVNDAVIAESKVLTDAEGKPLKFVEFIVRERAGKAVTDAQKALEEARKEMTQALELTPLVTKSTREIFAIQDKIKEQTAYIGSLAPGTAVSVLNKANAELEGSKALLASKLAQHDVTLQGEGASGTVKALNLAMAQRKAMFQADAAAGQSLADAIKQMFGDVKFEEEGITSEGFSKLYGGFRTIIEQAQADLDAGKIKELSRQTADQIKEGIFKMGEAAKTPLDLSNLKSLREAIFKIPVPEARQLFLLAVREAEEGVKQYQLSRRGPAMQRRLEDIQKESEKVIEAMRLIESKRKTASTFELMELEKDYKQHLVLLDSYYRDRIILTVAAATAEKEIQDKTIDTLAKQRAAVLAEPVLDTRKLRDLDLEMEREKNKRIAISQQEEIDVAKLQIERQERRIELDKQIRQGLLAQAAQVGGVVEKLKQANAQIDEEAKALREANDPLATQLIALKRITAEATIHRDAREQEYQLAVKSTDILQGQVALNEAIRDTEAAKDKIAFSRGQLDAATLRRKDNERAKEAADDQRDLQRRKEADLVLLKEKQAIELLAKRAELEEYLLRGTITQQEATKQYSQLQKDQKIALDEATVGIQAHTKAIAEFEGQVEKTGDKVKKVFRDSISGAITDSIVEFQKAAEIWKSLAKSLEREIVETYITPRIMKVFGDLFNVNTPAAKADGSNNAPFFVNVVNWPGAGGGVGGVASAVKSGDWASILKNLANTPFLGGFFAGGGAVSGPGTGTSDSIPALLSAGEHVMPASKAAVWMPVLEGIRTGRILPFSDGGFVQAIAMPSVIPRRYASGGMVMTDGGASAVGVGGGGGNMVVSLHPDTMNMTMREWLEHEVVRQQGRR